MAVEHERDVARVERGGALAAVSPTAAIDAFKLLDVYAGGLSDEAPRVEALATISAGYRAKGNGDRPGLPQRSTDGTIHLHDGTNRAPGLERALAATGKKSLTIAFPFDDPAKFIHCRFMQYSATELLAYGDETHMMVLTTGRGYRRFEAGSDEYARAVAASKVGVSVYFCLAEWGREGPEIVFPDGVGSYYRLRFTSRHSLRSILAGLRSIAQFTQGRIAGVPFDLTIDYREVAGKDGKKRTIPVWTIATKPPHGLRLTSRNFGDVMAMALEQGAALMLPAPAEPTFEDALTIPPDDDLDEAIVEGVVVGEPSDRELVLIQRGGRCDEVRWRAMFFSAVRGTELDGDESPARAAWLRTYTNGRTDSLSDFLHWATEREAQAMVVAASDELNRRRVERDARNEPPPVRATARPKRTFEELFGPEEHARPAAAAMEDAGLNAEIDAASARNAARARKAPVQGHTDEQVRAAAALTGMGAHAQQPSQDVDAASQAEPVADAESAEVRADGDQAEPTEAQRIVAGAIASPETFARRRADDWYAKLAAIAIERSHPYAARINAKQPTELDYRPLVESIRILLTYFPDVAVDDLDAADSTEPTDS